MIEQAATKTGRAGRVSALPVDPRSGFDARDVERVNARVSAQPSEKAALSDLLEGLRGVSWRHELALSGTIGGVRLA